MDLNKLDSVIQELEEQSKDLKGFNEVYSEIEKLKKDISDSLKFLQSNNNEIEENSILIKSKLQNSEIQLNRIEKELFEKIQELYRDNKNFQKEFDASIVTRLEKQKSDIKIEVRKIETNIKEAFDSKFNFLKILLFLIIGICIILTILLIIK